MHSALLLVNLACRSSYLLQNMSYFLVRRLVLVIVGQLHSSIVRPSITSFHDESESINSRRSSECLSEERSGEIIRLLYLAYKMSLGGSKTTRKEKKGIR